MNIKDLENKGKRLSKRFLLHCQYFPHKPPAMEKENERIVIRCKDVQTMYGVTNRTARRWFTEIRDFYNKAAYDLITIFEFCTVRKVDVAVVQAKINRYS